MRYTTVMRQNFMHILTSSKDVLSLCTKSTNMTVNDTEETGKQHNPVTMQQRRQKTSRDANNDENWTKQNNFLKNPHFFVPPHTVKNPTYNNENKMCNML